MTMPFGEILAAYQIYEKVIGWLKKHPERADRQMRMALKELHFSDTTIGRIEGLRSAREVRERERLAGDIAITQRDDRRYVEDSLSRLLQLSEIADVSIPASKSLKWIYYGKTNIRHELAKSILNYRDEDQAQLDELLNKIRELNAAIEKLDSHLGGVILGPGQ